MRHPHTLFAAIALSAALVGCSGGEVGETDGRGFNDADAAFATDMIQHHAQALQMVDLTMGQHLDPAAEDLADDIRAAQAPEIETMAGWLQDWDEPVPETVRDHANAHGDGSDVEMRSDMPGMMSTQDLRSLEDAERGEFQTMWLELMVEHHRGAIEMAEHEIENGEHRQVVALAEGIARSQDTELISMQNLLER